MDSRNERVVIETDRYRIIGDLTLPRDGYRSRMTDFLNAAERDFIALTAVTLTPLDGGEEIDREFLAVSRRHVVLAMPIEDGIGIEDPEPRAQSVAPPGVES
jgi:hypothetical protein